MDEWHRQVEIQDGQGLIAFPAFILVIISSHQHPVEQHECVCLVVCENVPRPRCDLTLYQPEHLRPNLVTPLPHTQTKTSTWAPKTPTEKQQATAPR